MSNISNYAKHVHQIFIIVTILYCVHINSALPGIVDDLTVVTGNQITWKRISDAPQRFKRDTDLTCDRRKPMQQCFSDCKTLIFCNGAVLLGQFSCPPEKPVCDLDLNICVTGTPTNQCHSPGHTDSSCAGKEGYFPDPANCQYFNYCEEGTIVQKNTCSADSSFDFESEECRQGAPCGNINCYGKTVALHSTYRHLYAFCENNTIIPGSYSSCLKTTEEFDFDSFECKTTCTMGEVIPHTTECNMYYRCMANVQKGSLEMVLQSCPRNQNFNKSMKSCDRTTMCN